MSEWESFGALDLSNVEGATGGRLQPGTYEVEAKKAEIETFNGSDGSVGNKRLVVEFHDVSGAGDIRENFNIHFPSSEKAENIGKSNLKSFLTAAGHPDPDRPKDIRTINGLQVSVIVGMGKPYTNKNGETRQYSEIKKFVPANGSAAADTAEELNDEIPF